MAEIRHILQISDEIGICGDRFDAIITAAVNAALAHCEVEKLCEVSVALIANEEIRQLNRDYRGIDSETDVLSFPYYDAAVPESISINHDNGALLLGDVFISPEKAAEQARSIGQSLEREIAFLCVHAALHLLGYDHETPADEESMTKEQREIMKKLEGTLK